MKDEELILKAVDYCNDIPARVRDFLRETTKTEPEPKFNLPAWYVFRGFDSLQVFYATSKEGSYFRSGSHDLWFIKDCRLATPKEIEDHLIKVAKEKGFIKGVSYRSPQDRIHEGPHYISNDADLGYGRGGDTLDCGIGKGYIYYYGNWATIITEKKKLPKTKGQLIELLHKCNCRPTLTSYAEFLKDYED